MPHIQWPQQPKHPWKRWPINCAWRFGLSSFSASRAFSGSTTVASGSPQARMNSMSLKEISSVGELLFFSHWLDWQLRFEASTERKALRSQLRKIICASVWSVCHGGVLYALYRFPFFNLSFLQLGYQRLAGVWSVSTGNLWWYGKGRWSSFLCS